MTKGSISRLAKRLPAVGHSYMVRPTVQTELNSIGCVYFRTTAKYVQNDAVRLNSVGLGKRLNGRI
jgi:hypothetical protein